ncbi:MAG: DUF2207 domain-containing protein [Gammaproteobacteria bacterium]
MTATGPRFLAPIGLLLAGCLLVPAPITAAERILDYQSEIVVAEDASMSVAEQIRVRAEGRNIRRGIYRDFPTDYRDRFGNRYRVGFQVESVTRDGDPEPWRVEDRANGVRVYVGDPDRTLSPGDYVYEIRFTTTRQLGFFADHDELYWNVTGNGWAFPIDQASARVSLPGDVPPGEIEIVGYTGVMGSNARNADSGIRDGAAWIETTVPLGPGEGLTLVASWPKGLVREPTGADRLGFILTDNIGLLVALIGLAAALTYLLKVWHRYGRDPRPGVLFPHYEPPRGFSPASARYIRRMAYDNGAFTAAVINLAVHGHLQIEQDDDDYVLRQTQGSGALAPGEKALLSRLFEGGSTVELERENHQRIGAARKAHRRALRRNYERLYFVTNSPLLLPSLVLLVLMGGGLFVTGVMTPAAFVVILLALALHGLFYYLLRAPTPPGRRLLDRLEGFRLFLDVAEKDDLNLRHPPELTPALFERYLPYAYALGVEQAWAARFADVFARMALQPGASYQPQWYKGDFDPGRIGNFTSTVGSSLGSAISSAATPPGSSSGGGGGGFSGGGGGGGGGGGW